MYIYIYALDIGVCCLEKKNAKSRSRACVTRRSELLSNKKEQEEEKEEKVKSARAFSDRALDTILPCKRTRAPVRGTPHLRVTDSFKI